MKFKDYYWKTWPKKVHKVSHSLLAFQLIFLVIVISNANPVDNEEVCGTVSTASGGTITLKEGVTLSDEEFEIIKTRKLKNAVFSPVMERQCVIKVCGFTSFNAQTNEGYIGSGSDYADCQMIKNTNTTAAPHIYNEDFNASSISCACNKKIGNCALSCRDKKEEMLDKWNPNECAKLYEEVDCNNCYFNPIPLKEDDEYKTDNSHQIRTILVRNNCVVTHNASALKQLWLFKDYSGVAKYDDSRINGTRSNIQSTFQNEPESFTCTCGTAYLTPPKEIEDDTILPEILISIFSTSCIISVFYASVFLFWRRRYYNNAMKTASDIGKRGSDESYGTASTELGYYGSSCGCSSLDYTQIMRLPYDNKYCTSRSHFQLGPVLDNGRFGEVCRGSLDVAIKVVKRGETDDEICLQSLQQEIKILSYLGIHENVLRLLGVNMSGIDRGEVYLITEFCENGSLKSYLKGKVTSQVMQIIRQKLGGMAVSDDGYSEDPLPESLPEILGIESGDPYDLEELDPSILRQLLIWCEQIANGMQYITYRKIVHVDLAARNVLLSHDLTAKIGDFGLSRKIYIKDYESSKKDSVPILWVAPESLTQNKYSSKSDVWAYGVTLWEIFSLGKDPYNDKQSIGEVLGAIMVGERLPSPQFAPNYVYTKICECWRECPDERPSFTDLRDFFIIRQTQAQEEDSDCMRFGNNMVVLEDNTDTYSYFL